LKVNGQIREAQVSSERTLLEFLRDDLGLKGTKEGCGEGDCGACTVIMDGMTVNSCLVLAVQAGGSSVLTIEGLEGESGLHPIQRAFMESGAVQCGYCTPGMILSAKALLDAEPAPSRKQIRLALSGNLCRCTGYEKILDAIELASRLLAERG
jgi:carbon-monoxide dehydrogenase small subunit